MLATHLDFSHLWATHNSEERFNDDENAAVSLHRKVGTYSARKIVPETQISTVSSRPRDFNEPDFALVVGGCCSPVRGGPGWGGGGIYEDVSMETGRQGSHVSLRPTQGKLLFTLAEML